MSQAVDSSSSKEAHEPSQNSEVELPTDPKSEEPHHQKLDEMIMHYTNESYLQDILADYREGYDFEFDEDELRREAGNFSNNLRGN